MISLGSLNSTRGIQMTVYIAPNMDTYSTSEGQFVSSDLLLISVLLRHSPHDRQETNGLIRYFCFKKVLVRKL